MKLYRSLMFRELRISRKHYLLITVLFLLVAGLMLLPPLLGLSGDEAIPAEEFPAARLELIFLSSLLSAVGAFAAGMNNGVHRADINSGYKRYAYVLPVTAGQQALADLLVKLSFIVLLGAAAVIFPAVVWAMTGISVALETLNIYLAVSVVSIAFDTLYCGVIMIAKDKRELKKYSGIAGIAGLAILWLIPESTGKNADGEGGFFSEELEAAADIAGSWGTFFAALAALALMGGVYYIVMKKTYERREP